MENLNQIVVTRFSKKLHLGDVVFPSDVTDPQTYIVVEVLPITIKGHQTEDYILKLHANDAEEIPHTEIFKVGTEWEVLNPSYKKNKKLKITNKHRNYESNSN